MKKEFIPLLVASSAVMVSVAGFGVYRYFFDGSVALPVDIQKQIAFKAYMPEVSYKIKGDSIKYDTSQSVLSYTVEAQTGAIVVAEQSWPETLIYDKLVSSMNAERELGVSLGTATITHPKNATGKEVAVVKANDTLLFITSDKKLSDEEWRSLINTFNDV